MKYRRFVGIDPGLTGGLVCLDEYGILVSSMVMPVEKLTNSDNDVHAQTIQSYLEDDVHDDALVVMEKVWAMPKQGVSSSFTFGRAAGKVLSACQCSRNVCRVEEVPPRVWQKALSFPAFPGDSPKKKARSYVEMNFPDHDFLATPRSKKPHEGLIDAACLAHYAYRMYSGEDDL